MAFEYKRKSTREELEYKGGNIPDGVYELMVDKAEYKENQSTRHPNGDPAWVAAVTLKVVEPEQYKGRLVFLNMNVDHPKESVEQGGQKEFERLLDAAGIEGESPDITELETAYVIARIGEERQDPKKAPDPNFRPRNRVARYYFADEPKPEIAIDPPKAKPAAGGANRGRPADSRDRGESRGRPADNRDRGNDRGAERGRGGDAGERGAERGGRGSEDRGGRGGRDEGTARGGRDGAERGGGGESRGGNDRNRDMREDMGDDIPFEDGREKGGDDYQPRNRNEGGSRSPFGAGRR